MEKLLLVGAGGLGRVVLEFAINKYKCGFVDDGYNIGTKICGTDVKGHIRDLPVLFRTYKLLVVTIGDNRLREKIYREAKQIGYRFPNIISGSAYISPFARVGDGCVILQNACVQNGAEIGDGAVINAGTEIHHDSFVDDWVLVYTNSVVRTYARIGKRVKIGSCVTIVNGSSVPDDEVVADGSVYQAYVPKA